MITETQRGTWTSASNAQADSLCPGRHLAQQGIQEDQTDDASFGTEVHAALAAQDGSKLTPEQEGIYESCLEIERKVLKQVFGEAVEKATPKPLREQRFWIQWEDGLRHSGQVDAAYRHGVKALIIEYKSLPGQVPSSPRNMQLRDQVCLVDFNTPLLKEILAVVIQPMVTHSPEPTVYSKEDITRSRDEMYLRVRASNAPGSRRVAGELQCKFCLAKHDCQPYQTHISSLVPVVPDLFTVPVAIWSPEQRQKFCDSFDMAQKWLDSTWEAMERGLLKDPQFVPGWKLEDRAGRSKITNLQSVFDRFSKESGSLELFMSAATIAKTDLLALTRTATKLKGKALDAKLKEIIGPDFVQGEAGKTMTKA